MLERDCKARSNISFPELLWDSVHFSVTSPSEFHSSGQFEVGTFVRREHYKFCLGFAEGFEEGQCGQQQGRPAHHLVLQNFKTNEAAAVSAHMNRDNFVCMGTALLLFCWLLCTASDATERSFTQKNKQCCCPVGAKPRLPASPHLVLTAAMEQYQLPKHSFPTLLVCNALVGEQQPLMAARSEQCTEQAAAI